MVLGEFGGKNEKVCALFLNSLWVRRLFMLSLVQQWHRPMVMFAFEVFRTTHLKVVLSKRSAVQSCEVFYLSKRHYLILVLCFNTNDWIIAFVLSNWWYFSQSLLCSRTVVLNWESPVTHFFPSNQVVTHHFLTLAFICEICNTQCHHALLHTANVFKVPNENRVTISMTQHGIVFLIMATQKGY